MGVCPLSEKSYTRLADRISRNRMRLQLKSSQINPRLSFVTKHYIQIKLLKPTHYIPSSEA